MRAFFYAGLAIVLVVVWFFLSQIVAAVSIAVWGIAWFIRNGAIAAILMAVAYIVYKLLRGAQ